MTSTTHQHSLRAGNPSGVWKHGLLTMATDFHLERTASPWGTFTYLDMYAGRGYYTRPPEGSGAWEAGIARAVSHEALGDDPFTLRLRELAQRGVSWGSWRWVADRIAAAKRPGTLELVDLYESPAPEACEGLPRNLWIRHYPERARRIVHRFQRSRADAPNLVLLDPPYAPAREDDVWDVIRQARGLRSQRTPFLLWYPISDLEREDKGVASIVSEVGGASFECRWAERRTPESTTIGAGLLVDDATARFFLEQRGRLVRLGAALGGRVSVTGQIPMTLDLC